jgi:predicted metalloprotease with PDZ domain
MSGPNCYVVAVRPGSDAEAKGLRQGDRIISINNFTPTREVLWKMKYFGACLEQLDRNRLFQCHSG